MEVIKWNWFNPGCEYLAILLDQNGEEVCNFGNQEEYYPTEGTEPNEHNKLIIAAAPKMLAMLQRIISSDGLGIEDYFEIEEVIKKATIK
jgi:hypothetical protein